MVRSFALIFGIVYLLVGIMGFIPAFVSPPQGPDLAVDAGHGRLLGIFPINVVHNIVHLLVGLWGIAGSRSFSGAIGFARGLAIVYGLLTIMGLIPGLNTMFGLAPLHGNDVWLHLISALLAAYFGWGPPAREDANRTSATR
ncbi:hypothetical protein HNR42_000792 [Deinobacterium chartae]|uniref:DUF4383 domain-containing protein n=1 Tax=Deinobacterium chartae TaxID=521158 RepID=A0A841HZF0_9DEIO|nr:DUF4383 domain-containing protein [Deinobacterium chartae]MBB6097378.1 hypothetical protein [Deinobacterium chartae]